MDERLVEGVVRGHRPLPQPVEREGGAGALDHDLFRRAVPDVRVEQVAERVRGLELVEQVARRERRGRDARDWAVQQHQSRVVVVRRLPRRILVEHAVVRRREDVVARIGAEVRVECDVGVELAERAHQVIGAVARRQEDARRDQRAAADDRQAPVLAFREQRADIRMRIAVELRIACLRGRRARDALGGATG